jgi:diadenosine tetraphosphate (Ap4A) HIT family hydrolase
MSRFDIHPKLKQDTIHLGSLNDQTLLLMNNSLVPWFIVLPKTDKTELYQLPRAERSQLDTNIDFLSGFISQHFKADKLNVAAIGNVVSQMHIHIVGRYKDDYCWPDVVWGNPQKNPYQQQEIRDVLELLTQVAGNSFTADNAV